MSRVPGFTTTDLAWNDVNMDEFITSSNSVFFRQQNATFAGLKDVGQRKVIIEYLKSLK